MNTLYIVAPANATAADLAATVDAYTDPDQAIEIANGQAEHVDPIMTVFAAPMAVDYSRAVIYTP